MLDRNEILQAMTELVIGGHLDTKSVELVGIGNFIEGVRAQCVANTATMHGPQAYLQPHTDARAALEDFIFDGGYDHLFDLMWS